MNKFVLMSALALISSHAWAGTEDIPQTYDWSGPYVVGSTGYSEGAAFGIGLGYDIAFMNGIVVGVEVAGSHTGNAKFIGNVAGKLGYAIEDFLPYIKVGLATGKGTGFVVGGGIDYAVTDNIFVGAEYDYTRLNSHENSFMAHVGFKF
jgi:outer membrane immunogenic protein